MTPCINISIIIPVYNAEKTLKKCIDSIMAQEYKDFELILVDDGSADMSSQMCDEYAANDMRIKVIHKQNGGVSSARNAGLEIAQGQWITFVDSDDYLSDHYLFGLKDSMADLVICNYQNIIGSQVTCGFNVNECNDLSLGQLIIENLTSTILRGPVAKFYRRELIDGMRFNEDMRIGEDACFVFQYLAKCRCYDIASESIYYVNVADVPDDVKYAVSVDYAVNSLRHLQSAFDGLVLSHGTSKGLFFNYIGYFKRISKADWKNEPSRWYQNGSVMDFYRYVWKSLSLKYKVRLVASYILKR